jgi:hypothetical protein
MAASMLPSVGLPLGEGAGWLRPGELVGVGLGVGQPGGGGGAEAGPVAPRAQEGLLHKILGVLDRAEHPIAVKLQLPVMALNQRGERRLLERRRQLLGGVHHQSMNRRPAGTSSAVCSIQQDQRQQPRRARRQLFEHYAPLSTSDAHRIG